MEVVLLLETGQPLLTEYGEPILLYSIDGLLIPERCRGLSFAGDSLDISVLEDQNLDLTALVSNEFSTILSSTNLSLDKIKNDNTSLTVGEEENCNV